MGVILCPKHGRTGITLVCTHISEQLEQAGQLPDLVELSFTDKEIGADFTIIYPLCRDCLQTYGLPVTSELILEWEEWLDKLPLQPVCGNCFNEQQAIQCNSPSST